MCISQLASTRIFLLRSCRSERAFFRKFLHQSKELRVVSEAASAQEALKALPSASIDLVIMDLEIALLATSPNCSSAAAGVRLVEIIRLQWPQLPILVLSGHSGDPQASKIAQALEAGARGVVSKNTHPIEMLKAIRELYEGRSYVQGELVPGLFPLMRKITATSPLSALLNRVQTEPLPLSGRQLEILQRLALGQKIADIGAQLNLATATVQAHTRALHRKLNACDRRDLLKRARERGLLPPS